MLQSTAVVLPPDGRLAAVCTNPTQAVALPLHNTAKILTSGLLTSDSCDAGLAGGSSCSPPLHHRHTHGKKFQLLPSILICILSCQCKKCQGLTLGLSGEP